MWMMGVDTYTSVREHTADEARKYAAVIILKDGQGKPGHCGCNYGDLGYFGEPGKPSDLGSVCVLLAYIYFR